VGRRWVGPGEAVYREPMHPYTRALLDSIPSTEPGSGRATATIKGEPPSPINPPSGCRFRTRCPLAQEICATVEPELKPYGVANHLAACHFALQPPVVIPAAATEQVS